MRLARDTGSVLAIAMTLALAIAFACRPLRQDPGRQLLARASNPGPEIERACELTGQRCTRCHEIDRVLNAKISHPSHWERYIEKMRMMNGSGIARHETAPILRCLVFWSFGQRGLQLLDAEGPPS